MDKINFFPDGLEVQNKKIILRLDLNVPLKDRVIEDFTRIDLCLPFVKKLVKKKAKIIIVTHLGRPKGNRDPALSLMPIYKYIKSSLKTNVYFFMGNFDDEVKDKFSHLKEGEIILVENIRYFREEIEDDDSFAKKLGSLGNISNFSFYYAHHMTTIEGGMVCTNSKQIDTIVKMKRGHGLLRDSQNNTLINKTKRKLKDLNSDFIFLTEGFNLRNNELSAVIGLQQLKRLDKIIKERNTNHRLFIKHLRKDIFFTDFDLNGSSNYAFQLILKKRNKKLFNKVLSVLKNNSIEYRVGSVGGGNQLRQPYLKTYNFKKKYKSLKNTEHMHFYGLYIGNYPHLDHKKIINLCKLLDKIKF